MDDGFGCASIRAASSLSGRGVELPLYMMGDAGMILAMDDDDEIYRYERYQLCGRGWMDGV